MIIKDFSKLLSASSYKLMIPKLFKRELLNVLSYKNNLFKQHIQYRSMQRGFLIYIDRVYSGEFYCKDNKTHKKFVALGKDINPDDVTILEVLTPVEFKVTITDDRIPIKVLEYQANV